MKKYIAVLMIVTGLCRFNAQTAEERVSDIEFVKSKLPELHYDLFNQLSQEKFNQLLDAVKPGADTLTDLEFALSLQQVIAQVGDSHSGINLKIFLDRRNIYPLQLYWLKDGFYVLAVHNNFKEVLGKKLSAINGISIEEIMHRFETIIVNDNEAIMKEKLPQVISVKDILDFLKITNENDNVFSFGTGNDITDVKLATYANLANPKNVERLIPDEVPLSFKNRRKFFWFEYLTDPNIVYAQYNRCYGKEIAEEYGNKDAEKLPSFEEFGDSLIHVIKNKKPDKLVFDMRFNGGGSSPQGTALIKKLAELDEINGEKGKLYVIIGRKTFSSAVINTMNFKQETNAILIGEETSGAPNHYGEVREVTIPYLNAELYYSTKYFKYDDSDLKAIEPDIWVEMSIDDFKTGKDPILEYIFNLEK